jgi:hypothetical protein
MVKVPLLSSTHTPPPLFALLLDIVPHSIKKLTVVNKPLVLPRYTPTPEDLAVLPFTVALSFIVKVPLSIH